MKIIHFADLHLGVETYGRLDPVTGISSRFADFLDSFDKLVDFAIKEAADLVVFCGDAYKSRDPSQTQQREFAKRIKRLSGCGIPVFLLVGNHDLPGPTGRATTTEIFDTLAVDGVCVAGKPDIYPIETRSGPVQVAALPWLKRSNVIARDEAKNLGLEAINLKMREVLTGIIENLAGRLDPAVPAMLAAHVWVQGAGVGSEDSMTIGQEHTLLLSAVANPAFDYVALGHIHREQVMSKKPPVVYAGSIDRLDFGDEDMEKGFYVVDIAAGSKRRKTTYSFQPIRGRRFITIEMAVAPDDPAPTDSVVKLLRQKAGEVKDNIVRFELSLNQAQQCQIQDSEIREAAKDAAYFSIAKKIERPVRTHLADVYVESITPEQALEAYLDVKHKDSSAARRKELLESGRDIIREEVIKAK